MRYLLVVQYEALRRVHLIPPEDAPAEDEDAVNASVFRNLDSPVSEGGENFSNGYVLNDRSKQPHLRIL